MAYLVLPWIILWLWGLFDLTKWPAEVWEDAGESRTVWFLLVFTLQFFGLITYLMRIRPTLMAHDAHRTARANVDS